ncbi:hypothetical protein [[Clostridium] aminophilum]|uniref:hypothetical protein n=1 Tax=[Clostridium] aminophilum TaxID=1526 RepID=UPI00332C8026
MEFQEYAEHYFDLEKAGPYFLISFLALLAVMGMIIAIARFKKGRDTRSGESKYADLPRHPIDIRSFSFIESFYEMAFASTAVLLLLSLYYIINDRINLRTVHRIWDTYKDWILVAFLMAAMVLNRIFDRVLVRLRYIDAKQRSSIRLLSSIYVILILIYICFIYQSPNYGTIIIYFVMMVIGRLFYFDVTWDGFRGDMAGLWKNLPILFLMIAYSAFTVWYGFFTRFLWKSNGVLVSTLIAHLFMDIGIVIIHHLRIPRLILK